MIKLINCKNALLVTIIIIVILAPFCLAERNGDDRPAKLITERTADNDGIIKILLYYDMEGLSGQNILTSIDFPRPEYFEARELLTDDINVTIDGLFEGGADSVFVVDAHGSFNPEPDVILDKMDPRAKMLFKKEKFHPYVDLLDENSYDAIVAVGMHSKTGGGGFAEHTINLGTDWILNAMSVNESEILAFSWGRIGIPLILVSGDNKLAEQLSWMTWLEYVTVKEARGIDNAVLYPIEQVHEQLKAAAQRSVANINNMKSVKLNEPITATLRVIPPADLSILRNVPGLEYDEQSVTFRAEGFQEAYDGMRGLLSVAQSGYYNIAAELFLNRGQEAFMEFKDSIFASWRRATSTTTDNEAATKESAPKKERLYFGSQ